VTAEGFPEADAAYKRAVADAVYVRDAWVSAGKPVLLDHPNGVSGVHPLLKAMQDTEALANRLRCELGRTPRSAKSVIQRGPGRPAGSASSPDRVRLRSVH
jgi:hypothetical protein